MTAAAFDDVRLDHAMLRNVSARGLAVRDTDLSGSAFEDVNLSDVTIRDANLLGMTINGVPVMEALALWRVHRPHG